MTVVRLRACNAGQVRRMLYNVSDFQAARIKSENRLATFAEVLQIGFARACERQGVPCHQSHNALRLSTLSTQSCAHSCTHAET